jgi:site-specific DNA recombinase
MNAIAYYRFSSDNQHEESIEAQRECVRRYAEQNNITIIKEYIDRAESATSDDRTNFQLMVSDIESGNVKPDYLIVDKFDRYCRNIADHFTYKFMFERYGIKNYAVLEPTHDSLLLEAIYAARNHEYSLNLSNEVKRKMKMYAKKALFLGGKPPLGYDVYEEIIDGQTRKKYMINEKEAEIVRIIFKMYLEGYSQRKIVDTLNQYGYKTKTGKTFSQTSIYEILRNEKYTGTYIFNRSASKFNRKRNHHKSKPPEEIIKIPRAIPEIIKPEDFKKIQEVMDRKKHAPGENKAVEPYLLTGLIICGACGGAMVGHRKRAGREKNYYYSYECNNRIRLKNCKAKAVNKHYVEERVIEDLLYKVFSKDGINQLVAVLQELHKQREAEKFKGIEQAVEELSSVENKLKNYIKAIEDGLYSPTIKKAMEELECRKEILAATVRTCSVEEEPLDGKLIRRILKQHEAVFQSGDLEMIKGIISQYIKQVTVYEDKIDVKVIVDIDGGGGAYTFKSTINIAEIRGSKVYVNTGTVLGIKAERRSNKTK